jgi:PAS domain S-box-containing protein
VEESLTGVYLLQEGYLMYANPKLCDMLGYSQEEFQQIKAIDFVVPDDRSILEENIKLRLRGERKNVIFSYRVCRKDGSIAELEGTGRVTEYNGKPAILGTLMDITERSHTDELLRKSDQLSIVGQLAAGVAHEIRNPLTSLKGFVQLIRSRSHEYTEFLDIMLSELDRINYIVSEFMLVAKPQAKQYQRNNIISIMDNVLSFLNSQAALFNVQFIKAAMSDALYVLCDENQIKQVFINLLKNAMEAMPKGGIVTIEMGYHSDRKVRIRIEDQGGGIPADKLAQLGEPFFTTKETGTGLGLMVCYKIIEAHKGCLNIQSVLGEGTLIDILLPEEQVLISS